MKGFEFPHEKAKRETKEFICWWLALPLTALLFWWYNHLWFTPTWPYLVWLSLAIPIKLARFFVGLWITRIFGLLLFASLVIQILSWAHIISTPIFK